MTYTQPSDVLGRWLGGDVPNAEDATLLNAIEDLEDSALVAFPDLADRIISGVIPLQRFKKVIAYATIRVLKTGQEFRKQYSETVGPFAQSATMWGNATGASLTTDELNELSPSDAVKKSKAFTFSVAPQTRYAGSDRFWLNGSYVTGIGDV